MFLGADVTHPAPDASRARPSLATLTGSLDPDAVRYAAMARNQSHRVEIIEELDEMAATLFTEYKKCNNSFPDKIIYLRDGVADGQFDQVIQKELPAIQKAFGQIAGRGMRPVKITVVIVQKRHHTRIFPMQQGGDRNGNVFPGTVVDTGIVHPIEFDFCNYHLKIITDLSLVLVPHKAFQGTVRPVHYRIQTPTLVNSN
jgi:eukaryotic translation initiation factor 2C